MTKTHFSLLRSFLVFSIVGITATGCVTFGNGKVSKIISNKEVEVVTTDDNLKVGDNVQLTTNGPYISRHGYDIIKLGEGKVASVSDNVARIALDSDAPLSGIYGVIFAQKIGGHSDDSRPIRHGRFQ